MSYLILMLISFFVGFVFITVFMFISRKVDQNDNNLSNKQENNDNIPTSIDSHDYIGNTDD